MTTPADQTAMLNALRSLIGPLAKLAVSRGLGHAVIDEMLRQAFVDAARDVHEGLDVARGVSKISATTGLHRREVRRLLDSRESPPLPAMHRWPAGEVFTRWLAAPEYRESALPRSGPAPSFESLARSVTQDIHPRSLLDELCRLGLARVDAEADTVTAMQDALVPKQDSVRVLGFLGDNVGDHLRAAAENALGDGTQHFEQAVYADELSTESLEALKPVIASHWQTLFQQLVPVLEARIADDKAAGRLRDQRVRIGLYAYGTSVTDKTFPRESES